MERNSTKWPHQKRATNAKGLKFCIEVQEAAENMSSQLINVVDKQAINDNVDLLNGKLNPDKLQHIVNPLGISAATFRSPVQSYPLCKDKIDLLVGEEWKRKFDYSARLVNPEAIRVKHEFRAQTEYDFLAGLVTESAKTPEEGQRMLRKFGKTMKDWKDLREQRANRILDMEYRNLDMKEKFNQGFKNLIIKRNELYAVEIFNGRTDLRVVDINNIKAIRMGNSKRIDDADIIIEETYESPGWVIDRYHDNLSQNEVKKIDNGLVDVHQGQNWGYSGAGDLLNLENVTYPYPAGTGNIGSPHTIQRNPNADSNLINLNDLNSSTSSPIDGYGNIRITRTVWRSMRQLGIIKWTDEQGQKQEKIVDENYKVNIELGEKVEWKWVSEYWRIVKIGNDIYPEWGPRPIQFRQLGDITSAGSGYIGDVLEICPTDLMKPFQVLYDIIMERTKHAFMTSRGKVPIMDLARKPRKWSVKKWYHYLDVMNISVEDSFSEGAVGVSKGKIAGNMQQTNRSMDLENGAYIQQHLLMLDYIEHRIGDIVGIPKAREGQSSPSETATGVQNSVTQSYHITEPYFAMHDIIKRRVLQTVLETTKYCIGKNPDLYEYYLDERDIISGQLAYDKFVEASLGIDITSTSEDTALINQYKQLAHAAIQNDKLKLSSLASIYESKSMSDIKDRIESAENEIVERQEQMGESQAKREEAALEREDMQKQRELKSKEDMNNADNKTEIMKKLVDVQIAELYAESKSDDIYQKVLDNAEKLDADFITKHRELDIKEKEMNKKPISNKN